MESAHINPSKIVIYKYLQTNLVVMKKIWSVVKTYSQSKTAIAIIIPQGIIKELGIKPGDRLQVSLDGAAIIYEKVN